MVIESGSGSYQVGKMVAETDKYRLYLCRPNNGTADHLLQVASAIECNGYLDVGAYTLERLSREAIRLEEEYARVRDNPKHVLNYQLCFPEIVDTFVLANQGDRRINILRFRGVDDVRNMVPLYNLVERDHLVVDLKTSAWILGKLLKILVFAHAANVRVRTLTLGNILIEPKLHYVVIFNWADAKFETDGVPRTEVREEIKTVTEVVIKVLGGVSGGDIPDDGSAEFGAYRDHLIQLAEIGDFSAFKAHQAFYALVDSLWPKGYHPFTSRPIG